MVEPSWPRCPRCHHPRGTGRAEADDCLHCREWPQALDGARCVAVLRPPATTLVHALKYGGLAGLAEVMGDRMAGVVARERSSRLEGGGPRPIVVPVPTTQARLRARGYNQAGLLARRVGQRLGLTVREPLVRLRGSVSQTALGPDERRENVRGVFHATAELDGRRVLLVDDVLTTGSTAGAAAEALGDVGARSVFLITFARALPHTSAGAATRGGLAA